MLTFLLRRDFLRREYIYFLTSGGQLFLLGVANHLQSRRGWQACLILIALISLFAWMSAYRRRRAITDTPTSKIVSAAQGYVELRGVAKALEGPPIRSPLNNFPCLWYRFKAQETEEYGLVEREHDDHGESDASFILDDGSGQCLVDPEGAEFLVSREETWTVGRCRYTQWLLLEQDTVYAIGEFSTRSTVSNIDSRQDINEQVKQLLNEWKKNPQELHKRFDLDGDGALSQEEWELARRQAKREIARDIAQQERDTRNQPELNLLRRPPDGRPYLISDSAPEKLALKYRLWSWLHLAIFFGALAFLPFVSELLR